MIKWKRLYSGTEVSGDLRFIITDEGGGLFILADRNDKSQTTVISIEHGKRIAEKRNARND